MPQPPVRRRAFTAVVAAVVAAELAGGAALIATRAGTGAAWRAAAPLSAGQTTGPVPEGGGGGAQRGAAAVAPALGRHQPRPGTTSPGAAGPSGAGTPIRTAPIGTTPIPANATGAVSATASSDGATDEPAPVSCQTDLSLADAPDNGYDFLCQQGGVPLTWPSGAVVLDEQGLSAEQSAAFAAAIPQWASGAQIPVAYSSDPSAADVVVTTAPLTSAQPGYTEDGYTTVSYRCTATCGYYHASVILSSTASLTTTDWLSTVLHELGHVAGLNHVARPGEVMYPYLTAASPIAYSSGDLTGFAILAAQRGS